MNEGAKREECQESFRSVFPEEDTHGWVGRSDPGALGAPACPAGERESEGGGKGG